MEGKKTLTQAIIESMMERHSKLDKDNRVYKWTCYYMAKTELYDRTLTDKKNPYDRTEAYLINASQRALSTMYEKSIVKEVRNESGITWNELMEEINKHNDYTAQMWIDEYRRLWLEKENN